MVAIFFILLLSNCLVNDAQAAPVTDKVPDQQSRNDAPPECPPGEHPERNMWQKPKDGRPRDWVCIPDDEVQK